MPSFAVLANDKSGQKISRIMEAGSKDALLGQLKAQGMTRIRVTEKQSGKEANKKSIGSVTIFQGKVKLRDLGVYYRQFATMINAGVSLIRCLDVLEQQTSSARLKEIIRDIESEVEGGATLSRAMTKHPRVFSNLATGLVRAGEVGGVLDETLLRLANFTEKDMELRRKVKAAMTYPIIIMGFAFLIVTGLVTFILPKFIQLFKDLGMKDDEFPLPTRMMMTTSHFLTSRWYVLIGGAVLIVLAVRQFRSTKLGKRYYDVAKLKFPVFGSLNHKVAMARFSRTLGTLLASGVPILQAMETVAGTVDNEVIADAVLASRASVREGDTISDPLAASTMFPPMVVQMIAIGEETGQLDSMLEKVADFYEGEVDAALSSLTAALEPILIVFMGVVVGFIVISMFLPLLAIITNLTSSNE